MSLTYYVASSFILLKEDLLYVDWYLFGGYHGVVGRLLVVKDLL